MMIAENLEIQSRYFNLSHHRFMSSKSRKPKPAAAHTILTEEDQALFEVRLGAFPKNIMGKPWTKFGFLTFFLTAKRLIWEVTKFTKYIIESRIIIGKRPAHNFLPCDPARSFSGNL